jgi:hypothetical protein
MDRSVLTCALIFDAALALVVELGADGVQQFVEALTGSGRGRHNTARRVAVIHGGGVLRKAVG